ncbi:hypothetical protein RERY_57410 [Rhodococcus erythropolis]|nr:hypothetical protein RERY_57410 [Rhodococcus erythropolis]
MALELQQGRRRVDSGSATPLDQRECQSSEQAVVGAAVENLRQRGQQSLRHLSGDRHAYPLNRCRNVDGRVVRPLTQHRVRCLQHLPPRIQLGHTRIPMGLFGQSMSPASHRRTRRFESHIPRRSARPGHLSRSRHQIRNNDSPGNPVDDQVMRSNDQAPGASGTEVDPHELNHHAACRIQPAESLVEALGSRENNCRLVRGRINIHPAE